MTVSQWADTHRQLDPRTSAEGGRWVSARVPYVVEIMDSATCWWVRRVSFMKSTQVGGTEALLNVLAWLICEDPGPVMFVMPTAKEAEKYLDVRVRPMVQLCRPLLEQLGEERGDDAGMMLKFRRCNLLLRTARVASDLSSDAIRWLFGDEVEMWPDAIKGEGNPWDLATERLRTFRGRTKAYMASTAGAPGGLIARAFDAGDRRRYHLPCPRCKHLQVLEWEQVRWPEEITTEEQMLQRKQAWYECVREQCKHRWTDPEKVDALAHGVWVPEGKDPTWWLEHRAAEDRSSHRSYHLWAGYSPFLAWSDLVAKWLQVQAADTEEAMQLWWNKWLGRPWLRRAIDTTEHMLKRCQRPYRLTGVAPANVLWVTAGVDVQEHYLPYVVRGWGIDGRSWLLAYGRARSFEDLASLVMRVDWAGEDQRRPGLVVRRMLIDARWREGECCDFARAWGPDLVQLSKASDFSDGRFYDLKLLERHPTTGRRLEIGVHQLHLNTGLFKTRLAVAQQKATEGDEPGCWYLPQDDVDATYLHEMTSEHQVSRDVRGKQTLIWEVKQGRRANHYWDGEVLAFAAASVLRIDAIRGEQSREQNRSSDEEPPRRRPREEDDDEPRLWRPR